MSVIIKGMEMPVTCCHCPLMGYDPDIEWVDGGRKTQGAYICAITHELIDNTKREDHCPLIPVPDHNGDLIDREWMRKAFYRYAKTGGVLYDLADEAPTIIPANRGVENG